jgi:hypothetical protein
MEEKQRETDLHRQKAAAENEKLEMQQQFEKYRSNRFWNVIDLRL